MSELDPTGVYCPVCQSVPGDVCRTVGDAPRSVHAARIRDARLVTPHENRPDSTPVENRPHTEL